MTWRKKRVVALAVLLTAFSTLGAIALFEKSLIGEVDPNLMKAQCFGGKDLGQPGKLLSWWTYCGLPSSARATDDS